MTDLAETIERWKSSIPKFDLLGEVSGNFVVSYKEARALLDAAEAGMRARDAALEEAAALAIENDAIANAIRSLRRPTLPMTDLERVRAERERLGRPLTLAELIDLARPYRMTDKELEQQKQSWTRQDWD